ncbi:MAG: hypothetical protein M0Q92_01770 [Methanoregula sp.]|jgi:hypothetical protein|nr:hypothetical protein [Methanoregula sp.]
MALRPIPPMLTQVVQAALLVCDKTEYFTRRICPLCGGIMSGYDKRTKRFAFLCDSDDNQLVEVVIHRAYCRQCGRIWKPEEPFYEGTRIGSPVVDLCQTLSASQSCGHVAMLLEKMGIKVDRWSVRSYNHLSIPPPQTVAAFGMRIPVSIITLSALANGDAGHISGEDILTACNYPSRCDHFPVPVEGDES